MRLGSTSTARNHSRAKFSAVSFMKNLFRYDELASLRAEGYVEERESPRINIQTSIRPKRTTFFGSDAKNNTIQTQRRTTSLNTIGAPIHPYGDPAFMPCS
jgi:hypothetical protein